MEGNKKERLSALGIDMDEGLEYCAGMEEFYFEVLKEYADTPLDENELQGLIDIRDFKEYRTRVHGVKSSSKTVGAMEVSYLAEKLESAAKEENIGFILENHAGFIQEYKKVISGLNEILS